MPKHGRGIGVTSAGSGSGGSHHTAHHTAQHHGQGHAQHTPQTFNAAMFGSAMNASSSS